MRELLWISPLIGLRRISRVAVMLATVSAVACYRPPREQQLAQNFGAHRAELETLLTMAIADRTFSRISPGEVPPRGMTDSRFREYKKIFETLNIENGVNWGIPGFPDGFFVLASTSVPMGAKGKLVGYVFSLVPPGPLVSRLPISDSPFEVRHGHGQEGSFRALEGGWYLFYEVDW